MLDKFKGGKQFAEDDMPDELFEEINRVTQRFFIVAQDYLVLGDKRCNNIVFGASQKLLGCLLGMMFEDKDIDQMMDKIAVNLKYSARVWRDQAEKKIKENQLG